MTDTWKTYGIEYSYSGGMFELEVIARSPDEALDRVKAASDRGTVTGEIIARIPAYPSVVFFVRTFCWLRNWFRTPRHYEER